jgi:hypothetical protein
MEIAKQGKGIQAEGKALSIIGLEVDAVKLH